MRGTGRILVGVTAALALAVGASCGGSSSSSTGASQTQPSPTSSQPKDAFCGAAGQLGSLQAQLIPLANSMGDPSSMSDQLDKLEARAKRFAQQAPAQIRDDIETLQGALSKLTSQIEQHPDDPDAIAGTLAGTVQSAKAQAALAHVQAWIQQHC